MPIKPENKKRYPTNWEDIRAQILDRANHCCKQCGAKNHQPHPLTGSHVVLTIAHLHDHRPENCDPGNLAALCQKCHNTLDAPMRAVHARETRRNKKAIGDLFDHDLMLH